MIFCVSAAKRVKVDDLIYFAGKKHYVPWKETFSSGVVVGVGGIVSVLYIVDVKVVS